ncbi:Lrp/AsnC family transcriptional regulator [Sphingomonas suaedae]|uniref:Lrp/AsnC family transcriptional regulator n=2 Tax=Sphingomonas suaedae TaxID=2599297 RepID=A0A518RLG3_9SPHN|nr:Lrp/AsnC family transcriptional regulator [Sphingomonas suaedae]
MDKIDRKLLALVQLDGALTVAQLAEKAGISTTPVWKRMRRLEEAGVIRGRVALLDPARLGLKLTGFVQVRTNDHSAEWLEEFGAAVRSIPEIIEVHRMAGDIDYLLKIVAPDIAGYDRIYKQLIRLARITDVSAGFSMEIVKETTSLPLEYAE